MSISDIQKGIEYWYNVPKIQRKDFGLEGRNWACKNGFTAVDMAEGIIDSIEKCFKNFTGRQRLKLVNINDNKGIKYPEGVIR